MRLDDFPLEEIHQMVDLCNRMTDHNNAKYGNSQAWLDDAADEADVIIAIWRNPEVDRGWEAGFLKGANADPAVLKDRPAGQQGGFKSIHIRLADLDTAIKVGQRYGDIAGGQKPSHLLSLGSRPAGKAN
ncbi:hypothetical protein MKK60_06520 [Methylobacterium sp. J-092]|nr:hypothetical protein [Methylobacterium sp. J-092]